LHRPVRKIITIKQDFEILTAVVLKSNIFWDITPCSGAEDGAHVFF
jgi:hypothetical protein